MHEKGSQFTQTMELALHHFNQCQHSSYYVGLNQSPQPHQLGRLLACFMPCLRFLKNFSKRMNKNLPLQITQNKKPQKQQWPKKKPTNREFLISLLQQLSLYILHTNTFFFLLLSLLLSCHSPKNVAITLQIAHN